MNTCLVLTLLASTSLASPPPSTAQVIDKKEDIYLPLKLEEGEWDAEITFYKDDKPADHAKGRQINTRLINGHWIVNQFDIPAMGEYPAYSGHGTWGYDPVAKTYVGTWVDTNDLTVRTDYGFWDAKEMTMTWSSKQNDGNGRFIDYRMIEEFRGNTRRFVFNQLGMKTPTAHPLVEIVFTKKVPTKDN